MEAKKRTRFLSFVLEEKGQADGSTNKHVVGIKKMVAPDGATTPSLSFKPSTMNGSLKHFQL